MSPVLFKIIVFCFLALIVFNLFHGLYFLVTGKEKGRGTVRALSWRIGLSAFLFFLLILFKLFGWVEPHSLKQPLLDARQEQISAMNSEGEENTKEQEEEEGKTLEEIQQQGSQDGRIRLKPQ